MGAFSLLGRIKLYFITRDIAKVFEIAKSSDLPKILLRM